jgi:hypothetical protein
MTIKNRPLTLLALLVLVGMILRWFNLFDSTSFFFDQARDALKVAQILQGHLALVGPATDTPGLFMGPLWYYFLTPLYWIFRGDPFFVLLAVSLLDILTIPLVYFVGRVFVREKMALFAAGIWAFNAQAVAYSRTLANPSTTVFWTLLFVYFLFKKKIVFASIFLAITFQLNPPSAYLLLPFVVLVYIKTIFGQVSWRKQILGAGVFIGSFFPLILFEIRHGFGASKNASTLILGGGGGLTGIFSTIGYHFQTWLKSVTDYSFPGAPLLAVIFIGVGITALWRGKKPRQVFFKQWLFIPVITYVFLYLRYESHPHYVLSLMAPVIFLIAWGAVLVTKKRWYLAVILAGFFVFANQGNLQREIFLKDHIAQPGDPNRIGLGDEMRIIDLVYLDAKGSKFGYYAYNVLPYWGDEAWQYLFKWQGLRSYGYLPERNGGDIIYVIYEPDPFMKKQIQEPWLEKFNGDYQKVQDFSVGEIRVRKMVRRKN